MYRGKLGESTQGSSRMDARGAAGGVIPLKPSQPTTVNGTTNSRPPSPMPPVVGFMSTARATHFRQRGHTALQRQLEDREEAERFSIHLVNKKCWAAIVKEWNNSSFSGDDSKLSPHSSSENGVSDSGDPREQVHFMLPVIPETQRSEEESKQCNFDELRDEDESGSDDAAAPNTSSTGARAPKEDVELMSRGTMTDGTGGVSATERTSSLNTSGASGLAAFAPISVDTNEARLNNSALLSPSQRGRYGPSVTQRPSSVGSAGSDDRGSSAVNSSQNYSSQGSNLQNRQNLSSFVSELALSSFQLSSHDEPVCVPVEVDAALLFVDISGYSKVSSALESKGAFALFAIVNSYVSELVDTLLEFNGEVEKFAGDAIKCLWYFRDIEDSVKAAVHCAQALQDKCGSHAIPDTDLTFSIHVGIVCGKVVSTVFRSATVKCMESCYHLISGEPLRDVGDVVDAAKRGETCVSQDVAHRLCCGFDATTMRCESESGKKVFLLQRSEGSSAAKSGCECSDDLFFQRHSVGEETELDFEARRHNIDSFVNPKVAEQLAKGKGQSELAEMRLLSVLFIHKSQEDIDIADWFEEVQSVIDSFRCGILQIIEDDKGVHVIAAVNLFIADREPARTGIQLADALDKRKCGCAIGLASGVTFSGVVGNKQACRFDITGNVCVQACRLMQHALATNATVAISASVVNYSGDASLTVPTGKAWLKGNKLQVPIHGIATVDTSVLSTITTTATACVDVHRAASKLIKEDIVEGADQRRAVLVRGCSQSGKASLCARTVYGTGIVTFTHTAAQESSQLDILRTVCSFFSYHRDSQLQSLSKEILECMRLQHNIRSMGLALELVSAIISKGLKYALIVRQGQRLDAMSISFLRQCMKASTEGSGRWLVFLTVVPQAGTVSWSSIATSLGNTTLTIKVDHLPLEEAKAFVSYRLKWQCDELLARFVLSMSSRLVGLMDEVCGYIEHKSSDALAVSRAGVVGVGRDVQCDLLLQPWSAISLGACAKASQVTNGLSLMAFSFLKVAAVLSNDFYPLLVSFAVEVAFEFFETYKRIKLNSDVRYLIDMLILDKCRPTPNDLYTNVDNDDGNTDDYVRFTSRATLDTMLETVLPAERERIGQLAVKHFDTYHGEGDGGLMVFAQAHHIYNTGDIARAGEMLETGMQQVIEESKVWEAASFRELEVYLAVVGRRWGVVEQENVDDDDGPVSPLTVSLMTRSKRTARRKRSSIAPLDSMLKVSDRGDRLPIEITRLRTWRPPIHFGALNNALRKLSIFITNLARHASCGTQPKEEEVTLHVTLLNLYLKFKDQIDRVIGFDPECDERELLIPMCTPSDSFDEILDRAVKFFEFTTAVVQKRADRVMDHVLRTMYVPYAPSYKPVFVGSERESLAFALKTSLENWEENATAALRNGLMELATQGWVPKNPEQNVEWQRDCYLRRRTHAPEIFLCLLFVNLSISTI